jgi:hypothetical protein
MAITDVEGVCKIAMAMIGLDPDQITDVTGSPSTNEEAQCALWYEMARDSLLGIKNHNWDFAKAELMLNPADGYEENYFDEVDITAPGITQADPAVVTATSHGFLDGWLVHISGVAGMTEINDRVVRVANKTNDTFECEGLNSTKFTAYSSGGVVIRKEALGHYQDGYVFRVPTDLIKPVVMENDDTRWEVVGRGDNRRVLADEEYPVLIYVAKVTTVTEMPWYFHRVWATRIALNVGPFLNQEGFNFGAIAAMEKKFLDEAMAIDAQMVATKHVVRDGYGVILKESGFGGV